MISRKLDHPHVLKYFEVYESSTVYFFMIEDFTGNQMIGGTMNYKTR